MVICGYSQYEFWNETCNSPTLTVMYLLWRDERHSPVRTAGGAGLIHSCVQRPPEEGKSPCASPWNTAKAHLKRWEGTPHTPATLPARSSGIKSAGCLLSYCFTLLKKSPEYKRAAFIINNRLMPRNLQNVIKSESASCLICNKPIKNHQVIFSSEGQSEEVTDEEKMNIHSVIALEDTCQAPWNHY